MPLLEIDNLFKLYRAHGHAAGLSSSRHEVVEAVVDVSLRLDQGGSMGIVGESGSGKTTLASLIVGLEKPSAGQVLIDGKVFQGRRDRKLLSRKVQLVWQDASAALDPRRTVASALTSPLMLHDIAIDRKQAREIAGKLLAETGLAESLLGRYPHELSGGQAQRVVIARALALDPQIMICDEPASALDIQVKIKIADLLMKLRDERNLTYIIIAHDLPLVKRMTESLAVMYRGTVVEQGPTRGILTRPLHPYTRLLIDSEPLKGTGFFEKADALDAMNGTSEPGSSGCRFAPRCSLVIPSCRTGIVNLRPFDDRQVACIRVGAIGLHSEGLGL